MDFHGNQSRRLHLYRLERRKAAGYYLQASLILFLISRFVMFLLLGIFRPTKLLAAMAGLGVVLALTGVLSPNMVGLIAVASRLACR